MAVKIPVRQELSPDEIESVKAEVLTMRLVHYLFYLSLNLLLFLTVLKKLSVYLDLYSTIFSLSHLFKSNLSSKHCFIYGSVY